MAYSTYFNSEKILKSHYYLFEDEDRTNLISPSVPAVISRLTPTYSHNNCSLIDQDEYFAAFNRAQISSVSPNVKKIKYKVETVKEKEFPDNNALSTQDNKLSTLNESPVIENSHIELYENVDLLELDNLFIAFITGKNHLMESFGTDSLQEQTSSDGIDILNLDEFFIVDKMPHTVNDLSYHSSKDNIVDLQQDILASFMYAQYLDQYFSMMPSKIQIDENALDDDAILSWADDIVNDMMTKNITDLPPDGTLVQDKCMKPAQSFLGLLYSNNDDRQLG